MRPKTKQHRSAVVGASGYPLIDNNYDSSSPYRQTAERGTQSDVLIEALSALEATLAAELTDDGNFENGADSEEAIEEAERAVDAALERDVEREAFFAQLKSQIKELAQSCAQDAIDDGEVMTEGIGPPNPDEASEDAFQNLIDPIDRNYDRYDELSQVFEEAFNDYFIDNGGWEADEEEEVEVINPEVREMAAELRELPLEFRRQRNLMVAIWGLAAVERSFDEAVSVVDAESEEASRPQRRRESRTRTPYVPPAAPPLRELTEEERLASQDAMRRLGLPGEIQRSGLPPGIDPGAFERALERGGDDDEVLGLPRRGKKRSKVKRRSVGIVGTWDDGSDGNDAEEWHKWKEGYQHTVEGKLALVAARCNSTPARVAIVAITSGMLQGGTIQDALFALDNIAEMYDARDEFYDLDDENLYSPVQRLDGLFLISREPVNARLHALQTGSPWGAPQIKLMKKAFGLVQRVDKDPVKGQAIRYRDSILHQLGSQFPTKEAKAVAGQVATVMLFPAFFLLPAWLGVGVVDGQISFLLGPEVIPSLAVSLARKPMQEVVSQHLREIMSAAANLEIRTLTFSDAKIKARGWMGKEVDYREAFRLLISGLYTQGIELIDSDQVQAVANVSMKNEQVGVYFTSIPAQTRGDAPPFDIYKNPSFLELRDKLGLGKGNEVRAFIDGDDLYAWNAYLGAHHWVAERLGWTQKDLYRVEFFPGTMSGHPNLTIEFKVLGERMPTRWETHPFFAERPKIFSTWDVTFINDYRKLNMPPQDWEAAKRHQAEQDAKWIQENPGVSGVVGAQIDPASVMLGPPPYNETTLNLAIEVLPRDLRILFAVDCLEHVLWLIETLANTTTPFIKIIAGYRRAAQARSERFPSLRPIGADDLIERQDQRGISAIDAFYRIATGDAGGVANLIRVARASYASDLDDEITEEGGMEIADHEAAQWEFDWQLERLRYYLREASARAEAEEASGYYATLRPRTDGDAECATLLRARALERLRTLLRDTKTGSTRERIESVISRLQEETDAHAIIKARWSETTPATLWEIAVWTINQLDDTTTFEETLSRPDAIVGGRSNVGAFAPFDLTKLHGEPTPEQLRYMRTVAPTVFRQFKTLYGMYVLENPLLKKRASPLSPCDLIGLSAQSILGPQGYWLFAAALCERAADLWPGNPDEIRPALDIIRDYGRDNTRTQSMVELYWELMEARNGVFDASRTDVAYRLRWAVYMPFIDATRPFVRGAAPTVAMIVEELAAIYTLPMSFPDMLELGSRPEAWEQLTVGASARLLRDFITGRRTQ